MECADLWTREVSRTPHTLACKKNSPSTLASYMKDALSRVQKMLADTSSVTRSQGEFVGTYKLECVDASLAGQGMVPNGRDVKQNCHHCETQ